MLRFPDKTQVRVNGLNEILADLYSEGRHRRRRPPNKSSKGWRKI